MRIFHNSYACPMLKILMPFNEGYDDGYDKDDPVMPTPSYEGVPYVEKDSGSSPYYASRSSDVFHVPSCSYVDRINAENLIGIESWQLALEMGYRSCKRCNP
ncbi:hypothetical protein AGMMS49983_20550 [Clostridia bacterium]|nr:hypothetical protein AGMMS49983_20550 [Clostridia bacterium]